MAARKPLYMDQTTGFHEEMAISDEMTLGALTMGGNIDMDSAGKITNSNPATAAGDALVYGQADAEVANLNITSGGNIVVAGGGEVTGLPATPTGDTAAASKAYVDSVAQGLDIHESVRAATTEAETLANDFENGDTIDGVILATGDRILIKNQADGIENGIYIVQASGAPARADDWDTGYEAAGAFVFVEEGDDNDNNGFVCSNPDATDTTGTHALTFSQFSGAGQITAGLGLTKNGNTIDVGAGDGIAAAADEISVDLATNPGLEFATAKLQIKVASANELSLDANGLNVEGVPTLFNIGATAVGATVTAPNLDNVTDGTNADTMHLHTGTSVSLDHADLGNVTSDQHHAQAHAIDGADHTLAGATPGHVLTATSATTFAFQAPSQADEATRVENTLTTATDATADGDPVYINGNDTIGKADSATLPKARVIGIIRTGSGAAGSTPEVVTSGPCAGILTGATANTPYFLQSGGGYGTALPPAGHRVIGLGHAKNSTDLFVVIRDLGRRAA